MDKHPTERGAPAMRRILARNIASLFSLQAANYLFPLITLPYLTRILGPAGYGAAGFALSFVQYFSLFVDYGFNLSATQAVAHQQLDKAGRSRTFWAVTACNILLMAAGSSVFAGFLLWVPPFNSMKLILAMAFLNIIGNILFPVWLFQGMERMAGQAVCNVVTRAAAIPFIFLIVDSPDDAWLYVLIQSLTNVAAGCASLCLIRKQDIILWAPPSWKDIHDCFTAGWHLFISTAAISLYTNSNVVILGLMAGDSAVGWFVAADKIRQAAQAVTSPITQAVYPRINALMKQNKDEAYRFIRKLTALLASGTFLMSLLLFVLAEPVIYILLGDRFLPAVNALRWLAFLPFLISLSNIFGIQIMLPLGMKREFSRLLITSGLLNLAFIVPLGYAFQASGAAAAVLLTETIVTAVMGVFVMQKLPTLFQRKRTP